MIRRLVHYFRLARRIWRDVISAFRRCPHGGHYEPRDAMIENIAGQRDKLWEKVYSPAVTRWSFELLDMGRQLKPCGKDGKDAFEVLSMSMRARPFSVPSALCTPCGDTLAVDKHLDAVMMLMEKRETVDDLRTRAIEDMGQALGVALAKRLAPGPRS